MKKLRFLQLLHSVCVITVFLLNGVNTAQGQLGKRVKDINTMGTAASSDPGGFSDVGGIIYFRACDDGTGCELWRTNGTEAGTVRVKDINPGAGESFPDFLTNLNGTLYFTANDGSSGIEVWKSDGTEAGTVQVKDINPGASASFPQPT